MAKISLDNPIEIPVEKFLQGCSKTELNSLLRLLPLHTNPNSNSSTNDMFYQFDQELKELLNNQDYVSVKSRYTKIKTYYRDAFIKLLKSGFIPDAAFDALPLIEEICKVSPLSPTEVVELMGRFYQLQRYRMTSLVKKPQLINTENHEENSN